MDWNKEIFSDIQWNGEISNKQDKEKIAEKIAEKVKDGDVIGFGSGSTSLLATIAIAKRIEKENLNITAIPTSHEIRLLCASLGIPTTTLIDKKPDWCFDGADEVDSHGWLIKGRGGAMFKEKLNIANSKESYILVDDSKFVSKLGEKFPVPIECFPQAICLVKEELKKLPLKSMNIRLAKGKDGPVITENGNIIIDAVFEEINENLEKELKSIVGVIDTGLFIGYPVTILH